MAPPVAPPADTCCFFPFVSASFPLPFVSFWNRLLKIVPRVHPIGKVFIDLNLHVYCAAGWQKQKEWGQEPFILLLANLPM